MYLFVDWKVKFAIYLLVWSKNSMLSLGGHFIIFRQTIQDARTVQSVNRRAQHHPVSLA